MKHFLNLLKILVVLSAVFSSSAFGVGQGEEHPKRIELITAENMGVVMLIIKDSQGSIISSGSAVFVASDQLSTAAHVLRTVKSPIEKHLFFVDPKTKKHIPVTQILQLDLQYDQAILKVENYKSDIIYSLETETVAEDILVVGFPEADLKADLKVVSGHVLNPFDFFINIVFYYFGEIAGMSGGAVFNRSTGYLAGILIKGISYDSYVQFVSAERVNQLLSRPPLDCEYEACYEQEKKRLKVLADADDPIAQYALAFVYRSEGDEAAYFDEVERSAGNNFILAKYIMADFLRRKRGNESEAIPLYMEAAEAGVVGAENELGLVHYGRGEMEKALYRFGRASEKGFIISDYMEGTMCFHGDGMENRDFACAVEKIGRAAERTFPPAELQMGMMYLKGEGVEQDEAAGMFWIERSAEQNWKPAIEFLEELERQ